MFSTGLMVFFGVALILAKLPRRLMLRALAHDLAIDLLVTVLVLIIHWGTFSGVMAATVAELLTSPRDVWAEAVSESMDVRRTAAHPAFFATTQFQQRAAPAPAIQCPGGHRGSGHVILIVLGLTSCLCLPGCR
jgi:hypothetical protein